MTLRKLCDGGEAPTGHDACKVLNNFEGVEVWEVGKDVSAQDYKEILEGILIIKFE